MAERKASVHLRGERLIVISESQTTAGFWMANGGFEDVPSSVDDEGLAASIERMLAMTAHDVPVPDWRVKPQPNPLAPVYSAVGVRGWRAFAGRALLVSVSADGAGAMKVTPWKREQRPRAAFEPLPSDSEDLDSPNQAELGAAVRQAFSKTT